MANESEYTNGLSHDQEGRHAHIWYKPLKIFLSGTEMPIAMKLGIHQRVLE